MVNYYKLINGTTIVGVVTSLEMRRFQQKHQIVLICTEAQAQFVQYKDKYYRAKWMLPIDTSKITYEIIDILEIEKNEYDILIKHNLL